MTDITQGGLKGGIRGLSNIIALAPRRAQAKFPAIAQVEAYWEGLRNGRPMPARAEVDPRAMTEVLEYAFVLERIAPGLARIRVAGRHLSDLLGMEVRGMPISALFLPETRDQLRTALEEVLSAPASVRLTLAGDSGLTRPRLEAQMYLAPLRDDTGLPTRILGALQAHGRIGRAPRRFAIREMQVDTLFSETGDSAFTPLPAATASRHRPRQASAHQTGPRQPSRFIPGYAEHATGMRRGNAPVEPAEKPARPALRLVVNNDA